MKLDDDDDGRAAGCCCPSEAVMIAVIDNGIPGTAEARAACSTWFGPCSDGKWHLVDTCPVGKREASAAKWPCGALKYRTGDVSSEIASSSPGPYSIGSGNWPGLSKLVEEMGEALQVAGKVMGTGGGTAHWDGTDLRQRFAEELADVLAAVEFFAEANGFDATTLRIRAAHKRTLFWEWHSSPVPLPTKGEKK